jgi:hypothetical protein
LARIGGGKVRLGHEHDEEDETDKWGPVVSEARRERARLPRLWASQRGHERGEAGSDRRPKGRGRESGPVRLGFQAAREKVSCFIYFFLLSFLHLFIFQNLFK